MIDAKNLEWDTKELRAKAGTRGPEAVEIDYDFLDAHLGLGFEDPTDVFDGELTIDLNLANAKCLDDGATVAGAYHDRMAAQRQLAEAKAALVEKDTQFARMKEAKDDQLARMKESTDKEREVNANEIARLQALVRDMQSSASLQPIPQQIVLPGVGVEQGNSPRPPPFEPKDYGDVFSATDGEFDDVEAAGPPPEGVRVRPARHSSPGRARVPQDRKSPSAKGPGVKPRLSSRVVAGRSRTTHRPVSSLEFLPSSIERPGGATVTPNKRPHTAAIADKNQARQFKQGKTSSGPVPQSPLDSAGVP